MTHLIEIKGGGSVTRDKPAVEGQPLTAGGAVALNILPSAASPPRKPSGTWNWAASPCGSAGESTCPRRRRTQHYCMQFYHAGIYRNDVLHRSLFIDATDLSVESIARDRDGHTAGIVDAANRTSRDMDPSEALPILLEQYPCDLINALVRKLDLVGRVGHFESLKVMEALNRPDDSLLDQKVAERFGLVVWSLRANP